MVQRAWRRLEQLRTDHRHICRRPVRISSIHRLRRLPRTTCRLGKWRWASLLRLLGQAHPCRLEHVRDALVWNGSAMHGAALFVCSSCLVHLSRKGDPLAASDRHVDADGFRLHPYRSHGQEGRPQVRQPHHGPATMQSLPVPVTMEILTVERIEFPVLGRLGGSRSPDIRVGERMPDERTDWHFPTEWARAAP